MKDFATYAAAKREGDKVVAAKAKGLGTALSPGQVADAQTAIEELQQYFESTGRRVSLRDAVGQYCSSSRKLGDRPLSEAVDGFLSTVATVKRVELSKAVHQFIESRMPLTVSKDGKRPQLSPGYLYIIRKWLEEFAGTFPGHAVCDLTREHLDTYIAGHGDVSARTRNGRRTVTKMFLKWAAERDMLPANHRLFSASAMAKEKQDGGEIEFYAPKELRSMLDTASSRAEFAGLLPVIALCGLAGIRLHEVARLTWEDVFRVEGHIEISSGKSKTRSRRLVAVCESLETWLAPYKTRTGPIWSRSLDNFHNGLNSMLKRINFTSKRNGLRHAFCTYHFALHANESLTAQQAGNSPAMIHAHYKGLATNLDARKWFEVRPTHQ